MIDDMEDVWRELGYIRDKLEDMDDELATRVDRVLDYLYMVEERL